MTPRYAKGIATLLNARNHLARNYTEADILQDARQYEYEVRDGNVVACVERKEVQWYQWEVRHLSVASSHEGAGLAFALYQRAERFAIGEGACILQCTIRTGNTRSEAFFTRQGYRNVGVFLYPPTSHTVGVWQKVVSPPNPGP